MVYSSKKDAWLVAIMAGAIFIPLSIGLYNLFAPGGNRSAAAILLVAGAAVGAAVLSLTYPLHYEITANEVIVRCGVLPRQHIPLSAIKEVFPTHNPLSAPAWSLDRLRINYEGNGEEGFVLISPKDKAGFMRELVSRGTNLAMQGDRVVCKAIR
jgi:hypothetical protein